MIVGVLTTCHTQYTWDRSICIFLFNRTTPQVFVTYLTAALYCRWTIVTDRFSWNVTTQNAFSLPFAAILVNCAPSGEMHNYCTPHIIKENFENFLIHRCNYILLSQVYCVWQVVKTPTIILNNPVLWNSFCPTHLPMKIVYFTRSHNNDGVLSSTQIQIPLANIRSYLKFFCTEHSERFRRMFIEV
jgi:hypothetical protein